MKLQPSLSLKISLIAFLNVVLLAAILLVFVGSKFRLNLSSFLFTPARERMLSVSRLFALQLPQLEHEKWSQSLKTLEDTHSVKLYLFNEQQEQLAGSPVELPRGLTQLLRNNAYAHRHRSGRGPGRAGPPGGPPPLAMVSTDNPKEYWAAVPIPIWMSTGGEAVHADLIWRFHSFWTNPFFFDYRPWLAVILAVVVVSFACWFPLVRGLTRTITQMTRATSQIAEGHFGIALATRRRDELGQLSQSINRMAGRLSDLVGGQRRFLSDIAHELCSPVARMQAAVGILEQRATERSVTYVNDVAEELTRMSDLIHELLSFSRADFLAAEKPLEAVSVARLAAQAIEREAVEDTSIQMSMAEDLAVWARPDLLSRSLANLVRNAVRYAGANGPITLSAVQHKENVTITVADEGPGLPEEELEKVFKPFYRPEFARQRETGGVGLGLAIVRNSVEACGGSVSCRNRTPRGFAVDVVLRRAGSEPQSERKQPVALAAASDRESNR